jgi:hypothetical protein
MAAWTDYLALAIAIAIPVGGGFLGSLFNGSPDGKSQSKSPFHQLLDSCKSPIQKNGTEVCPDRDPWTALPASSRVRLGSRLRCTLGLFLLVSPL